MTVRRAVVVATSVVVSALAAVGWGIAADKPSPSALVPGSKAQAALSELAVPSVPQPLAGSRSVSASAYRYAGGCESLRAAYQAADAPVPAGATVSVAGDGGLRFVAPFAKSAVFVRDDADGACTYEVKQAPNLVVRGQDVPAVDGFFTLTCFEPFSVGFLALAEIAIEGEPVRLFTLSQSAVLGGRAEPEPFTIAWFPSTVATFIAANGDVAGGARVEGLVGVFDPETRSGTITGGGPTGPVDVAFRCTVSNVSIPGL